MTTALERLSKIRTGNDFLNFYKTDTLIGCACDIQEVVALAKANQHPCIDAMRFEAAKTAMIVFLNAGLKSEKISNELIAKCSIETADQLIAELIKNNPCQLK